MIRFFLLFIIFIPCFFIMPAKSASIKPCKTAECIERFNHFKKAARRGYLSAEYNTGKFYYFGYGTEIDQEKALHFYRKAAVKGTKEAQFMTGLIYITNDKLQDYDQGIKWLERAAKYSHVHAAFLLGKAHALNIEGQPNYIESDKWLTVAFDAKYNKVPQFVEDLVKAQQFNEQNYPTLHQRLIEENIWVGEKMSLANWDGRSYERITVTGHSQAVGFDNLLAKFRGRNDTSGSRLKNDCAKTGGCQRKSLNEMKDSMWVSQK